ncbi:hypothetical protein ACLOJK_036732, partial [Asimina triloba]
MAATVRSSSISTASKYHRSEFPSHGRPNDRRRRNPSAASVSPPAATQIHRPTTPADAPAEPIMHRPTSSGDPPNQRSRS